MAWTKNTTTTGSSGSSPSFGTLPYNAPSGTMVMTLGIYVTQGGPRGGGTPTSSHGTWVDSGKGAVGETGSPCYTEVFYILNPSGTGSNYSITIPNSGGNSCFYVITSYQESSGSGYLNAVSSLSNQSSANPSLDVVSTVDNCLITGHLVSDANNLGGFVVGSNYTSNAGVDMGQDIFSEEYDLDGGTAGTIAVNWTDGIDEWGAIAMAWANSEGTAQVNKDLQANWDILNLVNKDLAAQYDLLNLVNKDLQGVWDINVLVNKDLQAIWDMDGVVSKDLQALWDITNLVNKDLQTDWDIFALVNKDLQADWDIANLVSKDLQALWDMEGIVNKDLQAQWDIAELVNKDLQALWDILILVNKDLQAIWDMRQLAGKELQAIWDMSGVVNKDLQAVWDLDVLVNKDIQGVWDILNLVNKDLEGHWDILALVNKDIQAVWDIEAGVVFKDIQAVWDILQLASEKKQRGKFPFWYF